jgi:hypothetical protein
MDNYYSQEAFYYEKLDEFNEIQASYLEDYENEVITEEEYLALNSDLRDNWIENYSFLYGNVVINYMLNVLVYLFIGFNILYYIYMLATKGNTLGRKMNKIQLVGNVKWYTLLLREILWKNIFWVWTLSAGIAVDFGFIVFTQKKRTL